jgi:uncharacterized protein (TIGR02266 family)
MSTPHDRNDGTAAQQPRQPRRDFQAEIALSLESDHNFYTGFTENISSGGLFIATRDLKPRGTILEISFTIPDYRQPIKTRVEVRWQRLENIDCDNAMPGIGVRFLDLAPDVTKAINAFIQGRDTLFYDDE